MSVQTNFCVFRNGDFVDLVINAIIWPAEPDNGIYKPYLYEYEIIEGDQDITLTDDEKFRLYNSAMELFRAGCFE